MFWLWMIALVSFWIAANGTAFLSETGPMWRWARPAGAPEWETDCNGKFVLCATWLATLMDLALAYIFLSFIWFSAGMWFRGCSLDPLVYSPCLITHWLLD